jgi:predicted transcriptional regulator
VSKAIIEITRPGAYLAAAQAVASRLDAGEDVPQADYHLGFASAAQLFAELTPSRMALLEAIQHAGPTAVDALAEQLGRAALTVQADADKLVEHDLVHTDADGRLFVPWDQVQLKITLPADQAA